VTYAGDLHPYEALAGLEFGRLGNGPVGAKLDLACCSHNRRALGKGDRFLS
jgi:hypothetical protein